MSLEPDDPTVAPGPAPGADVARAALHEGEPAAAAGVPLDGAVTASAPRAEAPPAPEVADAPPASPASPASVDAPDAATAEASLAGGADADLHGGAPAVDKPTEAALAAAAAEAPAAASVAAVDGTTEAALVAAAAEAAEAAVVAEPVEAAVVAEPVEAAEAAAAAEVEPSEAAGEAADPAAVDAGAVDIDLEDVGDAGSARAAGPFAAGPAGAPAPPVVGRVQTSQPVIGRVATEDITSDAALDLEELEEVGEAEVDAPAAPTAPRAPAPPPPPRVPPAPPTALRAAVLAPPVPPPPFAGTPPRASAPSLPSALGRPAPARPPLRDDASAMLPPSSDELASGRGDATGSLSIDDVAPYAGDVDTDVEDGALASPPPAAPAFVPLEALLEVPTAIEREVAALDAALEPRADALAAAVEEEADPATAAGLAYELGELAERRLADEARAVKAFGRALTLDPSLRANLWAIRRVFYRRKLWPNLARLIDAELAYARDDGERADLLVEKARVLAGQRGEAPVEGDAAVDRAALDAEARGALEEAVVLAPGHQGALLELERLLLRAGERAALVDVWERLGDAVAQPARRVGYWLEAARSSAGDDLARAEAALGRAAAAARAGADDAGAVALVEQVARERLRLAETHGGPAEELAALEGLATHLLSTLGASAGHELVTAAPQGEAPGRAAALRLELVALRRRSAQLLRGEAPERAWDALQQALAVAPHEPLLFADLTELAEELGRFEELAELVQGWEAVEGDPGRAMLLSIRRADALLRAGQHDQAHALLASLEASAPGYVLLTSAAERDALARGDVRALARAYASAAGAAALGTWLGPGQAPAPDPLAAAALYVQAAELWAAEPDEGRDLGEARAALAQAMALVPDYPPAVEALVELDDLVGDTAGAVARLRAQAAAAGPEARRALLERAVRVARGHGGPDALGLAVALERELVDLAPGDLVARWRLEATLAQLGRAEERAALLAEVGALEPDAGRRAAALLGAARLREQAGQVDLALAHYLEALQAWPEDAYLRDAVAELLRSQGRWTELVDERRAAARRLPDGPAAVRALREAAWVLEHQLGDHGAAARVYDEWHARIPDDRAALDGLARCRTRVGDHAAAHAALAALADLAPGPRAAWMTAGALERAGRGDDAADAYRELAAGEAAADDLAAATAAVALVELGAARRDTALRAEAAAALARRSTAPALAAALAEDGGWLRALVLEDFDGAAASFAAAVALAPASRGALLGAALVASRRGEVGALGEAYEGLAAAVAMPEASAALYLRAASIAAANGDLDLANARVAAARQAAPDDVSALVVVAEAGATPVVEGDGDPRAAIDALLGRAEVLELRGALVDDPAARAAWELDRAEALELAGRLREAGAVVAAVLRSQPDDLRGLAALRRLARRAGDERALARASYVLALRLGDRVARLELLREAAALFDLAGGRDEHALAAYRRILAEDPGAPELDRVLALARQRGDLAMFVGALSDRLAWHLAEGHGAEALVPLLRERAAALAGAGDPTSAMADLDALLALEPEHLDALVARAELALHAGDAAGAVALWRRCLPLEARPAERAELELQLSRVLEEDIHDLAGAMEQLERVVEGAPADVGLRERLLGLATRARDWDRAARELRELARLRATPGERARDELRLGQLLRDRVGDRVAARLAFDRARGLDPLNVDVLRELVDLLDVPARGQVLAGAAATLREQLVQTPATASLFERLASVAAWQRDVDARWLALVGLEALGTPAAEQRQVLAQGRAALAAPRRGRLEEPERAALRGAAGGACAELWRAIAPAATAIGGVDAAKLGFARGDRLAARKLTDRHGALAVALGWFGLDDVELYVSDQRAGVARVLGEETPVLCLGGDVASGATPLARFLLGRCVAAAAERLAGLAELRDGEAALLFAAALRAAEVALPPALAEAAAAAGPEALLAERARALRGKLARKDRAAVAQLGATRAAELAEPEAFRRAALAAGNRAGLLWCGDLGVALAALDVGRGARPLVDSPAALELAAWSVSGTHQSLRDRLGVALGAAR